MNTICLSENANKRLKDALRERGHRLIEIRKTDAVYDAVSSHADIYLCKLGKELVIAPEQLCLIKEELQSSRISWIAGEQELGFQYPNNIRYNAVQMGRFFIHNTKHTDPLLLSKAKEQNLLLLPVKQGYTKCNLVVVDDNSVITSDMGIASVLTKHKIDTLLISSGHVALAGFPYGFLGGASGRVGDEIIFNGNLLAHPDFQSINDFIRSKGLRVFWFEEYPLEDIGSIIQI